MQTIEKELEKGLQQLGLSVSPEPLLNYLMLLQKWNKAYNLTAIRDLPAMLSKHLLDSLAISPWLQGPRLIDVGTGAGLPGIPLAIAHPHLQVSLLDSNGKKIRFLQEVKRQLDLSNIEIIESRVENYKPATGFDTVISRAFSDLSQMISWTKHLLASGGIWLAMKGRYPEIELSTIDQGYKVIPYSVPGLDGERCCIIIANTSKE
ncbi:glucose inhibited division protein B GidB [Legionella quinlivanii]|uniref:Ribosomal RNA small subunit methyltransferase G n=1 Tax=Legionella quinlivanii TaxID=45073 RepID=A0A0W0Y5X4_9GAMM|nr:16S rRNA (guanine(527)-N(7))-methyltransferase RsmG [Legionella quinlivanii]KTD52050.1 glucose inhibited division protein B GidB [Legionella quinlivanii]MCW8452314.1 16S rRNA (guanine(527)-N(7))-methyltransferase RsmG [Legionella quinlivanii]SEF88674.1 16S rRNA (guanine527-N7)-methyltransferase [Legionella quinlivanii DSM 21216]STY12454.1 glucose inhibited division protein B GidB [Legionella quinlivanii]